MKNQFHLALSLIFILRTFSLVQAQSLTANNSLSNIRWYGEEITGNTHFGNLSFKEAQVDLKDGVITGGKFIVDMNSLTVEDLSGGSKARLEGHLKSKDFFSVENNPQATLEITQKAKVEGEIQTIYGELIIKGIKHPIDCTITFVDNKTAKARMTFDRSKYNVRFRSGSFFENLGDKLILDDIKMEVSLKWN